MKNSIKRMKFTIDTDKLETVMFLFDKVEDCQIDFDDECSADMDVTLDFKNPEEAEVYVTLIDILRRLGKITKLRYYGKL